MSNDLRDLTANMQRSQDAQAFVAWGVAQGVSKDNSTALFELEQRVGPRSSMLERVKNSGGALTTSNGSALAPLRQYANAFLEFVRMRAAFDRLAAAARQAPLNVVIFLQTVGSEGGWVGEGQPIPVVRGTFTTANLPPFKLGSITAITKSLAKSIDPRSLALVTKDVVRGVALGTDRQAFDPDLAAVPGISPSSLTFGATEIAATGDIETDFVDLVAAVPGESLYIITNRDVAVHLLGRRNLSGQRLFPEITVKGGTIAGIPVLISSGAPNALILVDADGIAIADEGIELDSSGQAAIQMDDAPATQDGTTGVGVSMVSLFQTNLIGIRSIRYLNWARRSDAVAFRRVHLDSSPVF